MRKFFQKIGMITLICLSFIYTERAATVLREVDDIMVKIKEENNQVKIEPVDAVIKDDTIIPGIKGRMINEQQSYNKLKKIGEYNSNFLIYKELKPSITIENQYHKYIVGGNESKKMVSLIFIVRENDDISKILSILKEKDTKVNFFIDSIWLENNNELLVDIINEGHIIGNLSYNMDYSHSDFIWMNTIIGKVGKQKQGYCYNEVNNKKDLEICAINKNYVIRPNVVIDKYPSLEIKESLKSGIMISLPVKSVVIEELNYILNYIKSKGLKIGNLNSFLSE